MELLAPDPDAQELAKLMIGEQAEDTMRAMLEETLQAAEQGQVRESGRTACGDVDDVRGPLARYPRSVDLAGCPIGDRYGIWHTHITAEGIREPTHSLPDYANVVFGVVDASVIVGTQSAHVTVRADDTDAAIEAFREAIGHPVDSPADVVELVGQNSIDILDAQERVDEALRSLSDRVETGFPDLESRLDAVLEPDVSAATPGGCTAHTHLDPAHTAIGGDVDDAVAVEESVGLDVDDDSSCVDCGGVGAIGPTAGLVESGQRVQARCRRAPIEAFAPEDGIEIRGLVIGNAIGTVVGTITSKVVFGDW